MNDHDKATWLDSTKRLDRRGFLKSTTATSVAAITLPLSVAIPRVHSSVMAPSALSSSAVKRLYESLSREQRSTICLPVGAKARSRINPNWHVTEPTVGSSFYGDEQRKLIDEILRNVTSPDGYERMIRQMNSDTQGGINGYSIAFFGNPDEANHQWIMTGRHLTLRADSNTEDKTAFGGPIVYGHGIGNPKRNVFHYQTQKANEVFSALDVSQAKKALLPTAPPEGQVAIQGEGKTFAGVGMDELSDDQKQLVKDTLGVLLAPYREQDVTEAMSVLETTGGLDRLRMAFFQQGDLRNDKIWDMWRIEGPGFVWSFRGAPHVHAYINIAAS